MNVKRETTRVSCLSFVPTASRYKFKITAPPINAPKLKRDGSRLSLRSAEVMGDVVASSLLRLLRL
jgi:hypothetical protein